MTAKDHSADLTRQIELIHLSDVHFGRYHRFNPPRSAGGDQPDEAAFPSLLSRLSEELEGEDPRCPVVICVTGDFVETGDVAEYLQAEEFLKKLAELPVLGKPRGIGSIFIVPGNHDVQYDNSKIALRWQQWTEFHNRLFGTRHTREDPWAMVALHDRVDDLGALILTLNSSIYVQKGEEDEERGRLDVKQLTIVEDALEAFDSERLESAIRVALVHHHPVLIPPLSEPGRGYDAIHNSGKLLTILRRYGFHIVLHGHKHNPFTFTDDAQSAYQNLSDQPIFIAAGGSCASVQLPQSPRCENSYNHIVVKWHPSGRQARIHSETRSLRIFNDDGTERLPTRWSWESVRVDDRHFFGQRHVPSVQKRTERNFDESTDGEKNKRRLHEYERTRGNLPVVQVLPSLVPGQAYEAILWLVPHPYAQSKPEKDIPEEVTWSAGPRFEVVTVKRLEDPNYTARLTYWGPMLVQARIRFSDGYETETYVYARMPSVYHATS